MDAALTLAAQGGRAVMPNPLVGAVLVHNNTIISSGFHEYFGGPHAEVNAILALSDHSLLPHATLYVTLEPCAHHGKTPPCTDLIVQSGIPSVVIGCLDPFPQVAGRGVAALRAAGVHVTEGVRHREASWMNRRFIVAHRAQRPYVILKWAETSDGFLARPDLSSRWISCPESRQLVHQWRAQEMGILVGTTTARVDNPQLTVRDAHGPNPVRVTIDAHCTLPATAHLFDQSAETIIFNASRDEQRGLTTWVALNWHHCVLSQVFAHLYHRQIISVIIEGGAATLARCIAAQLWDEARVFISPSRFGAGIAAPRLPIAPHTETQVGSDLLRTTFAPGLPATLGTGVPAVSAP